MQQSAIGQISTGVAGKGTSIVARFI